MKNTMFADNINEKVAELKKVINELMEFARPDPVLTENASDLEKVHSLCFLRATGDLIETALAVEYLVKDSTEEEFEKMMTDDGAKTISEVKNEMMLSMAMEALTRKSELED